MSSGKKYLLISLILLCFPAWLRPLYVPAEETQRSINVFVDPRMELLAAVQLLSDYFRITKFEFSYKQEIRDYFWPYKNHPVVSIFKDMSNEGFNGDAPPAAMLFLSDPPLLDIRFPFSDYIKGRAGGELKLQQFVETLRDFAVESKFTTFFNQHEGIYLQFVNDVNNKMTGTDYINTLESYYGWKQHSYNITLVPLFHTGGYGCRVEREGGIFDIYSIIGPLEVINDFPNFGSVENFRNLTWHEFSHSFVNPTTEKFQAEIDMYSKLLYPIYAKMKEQGYGTWETCVNEHIVRAITSRFTYHEMGQQAADQELNYHKNQRGFLYIDFIYRRLEYYETQRNTFPTLVDFYPDLINMLRIISENSALFVFSGNR